MSDTGDDKPGGRGADPEDPGVLGRLPRSRPARVGRGARASGDRAPDAAASGAAPKPKRARKPAAKPPPGAKPPRAPAKPTAGSAGGRRSRPRADAPDTVVPIDAPAEERRARRRP